MEKTAIELLEKQIEGEITRLSHISNLNLEKEEEKLRVYKELVREILENYE